jgi:hypothetical protein
MALVTTFGVADEEGRVEVEAGVGDVVDDADGEVVLGAWLS